MTSVTKCQQQNDYLVTCKVRNFNVLNAAYRKSSHLSYPGHVAFWVIECFQPLTAKENSKGVLWKINPKKLSHAKKNPGGVPGLSGSLVYRVRVFLMKAVRRMRTLSHRPGEAAPANMRHAICVSFG